jgi:hypothetical protein
MLDYLLNFKELQEYEQEIPGPEEIHEGSQGSTDETSLNGKDNKCFL